MKLLKNITLNTYKLLIWTAILAGSILTAAAFWITQTFGVITVDQMMMNLTGADQVDESVRESFILEVLVVPAAFVLVVYLVYGSVKYVLAGIEKAEKENRGIVKRFITHGATYNILFGIAGGLVLSLGATSMAQALSFDDYVKSTQTELTMDKFYIDPSGSKSEEKTGDKKNLILIFLESMENGYSDVDSFGEDVLAGVKEPTSHWDSIKNLEMYNGGGWTMSGLISTMCGVPNRAAGLSPDNKNDIGSESETFMGNAVCLGDVLKRDGYQNVFMGGADKSFASKGVFLNTHGYDRILDRNVWEENGEESMNDWGLGDKRLFENAKEEVERLRASNQPYNLTMLTVDSHEPAHLLEGCSLSYEEQKPLIAATRCSMDYVGDFINYLEEAGVLEDTVVVLTGDHLKTTPEGGVLTDELAGSTNRTIFNRIYHPDYRTYDSFGNYTVDTGIQRHNVDQMDWYGTLLSLMNLGREDGRAGVGSSVYSPSLLDSPHSSLGSGLGLTPSEYAELITSRSRELYRWIWAETDVFPEDEKAVQG